MNIKVLKRFLGKKKKGITLSFHYAQYFSLKQPKTKQIIVCFDGLFPHGGLVDRLKGIVSCYQIAKALGYDFKILFDNPFPLSSFLEPNSIDWTFKRSNILWHPTKTKCLYLMNDFSANPMQLIKKSSATTFFIYANIDYSKTICPDLSQEELEQNWRISFNQLFKKSELLKKKLNEISTEPFIAFHTRFTSLMGDFTDTTTKILSAKAQETLSNKVVQSINNIKNKKPQNAYLFSDSINFINYAKTHIKINTVEGDPFHMDDFKKTKETDGHLKTMIDFFMISKSETVFFIMVKPMYNSSFSKYAAIIGDTKFKRVEA